MKNARDSFAPFHNVLRRKGADADECDDLGWATMDSLSYKARWVAPMLEALSGTDNAVKLRTTTTEMTFTLEYRRSYSAPS